MMLALVGCAAGWWCSKQRFPFWLAGYTLPMTVIVLYGVGMHVPSLTNTPPFSWLVGGRTKFAIIGLLAALVLWTPLSRIRRKQARVLIVVLLGLVVWQMSVWPFLAPAFNRRHLAALETTLDADGICRQSNSYNCGPAAAVTALRRLGFPAEEGQIAILAHTSSAIGTPPDLLARALQKRYGPEGLIAAHRSFKDVSELAEAGLTLAIVKFTFMLDHYVVVLEVTDQEVLLGDPLRGLIRVSVQEFGAGWRHHGVVLRRVEAPRASRDAAT